MDDTSLKELRSELLNMDETELKSVRSPAPRKS
jgi:hypothetical protein